MLNHLGQVVPDAPGAGVPPGLVAGPRPGQIYVPGVGMVEVSDWTQNPIYDTEIITTVVAQGQEFTFFRSLDFPGAIRKDRRYTNMTTPNQLPSGWRGVVYGMAFYVIPVENTTPEDVARIMTGGAVEFMTGNQKIEKEGPLLFYPSPYGMTGPVAFNGPGFHEFTALNNGVASLGAVPKDEIIVDLVDELTFFATVEFPGGLALDNNCFLQCVLRSFIRKPVR